MGFGMTKAERLQEMERLYFQRAHSDMEMAERLGVNRSTVFRDRTALEAEVPFVEEAGRYRINRSTYLSQVRLNLNEALALYLAARRASLQSSYDQGSMASALEKLAMALRQPMTSRLVRTAERILAEGRQAERGAILETVARGWVELIPVLIEYQGLKGTKKRAYVIKPYLIEPSPWSTSIYVIGESDRHAGISAFKVERIQSAQLTTGHFSVAEDFDEERLLRYAWGIWFEEKPPVRVRLRFQAGYAAKRLRETRWHPTQRVEELADGGCVWEAQVAAWEEMQPWVRGWGAEVEVLEPLELREAVRGEVERLVRVYGVG